MTASPLARAFFEHALAQPRKTALLCEGAQISYGELAEGVRRLAAGLTANGVRHGDHIGVALYNSPDFARLLLAAADLGVVLAPVPPSLPAAAMRVAFHASSVRHVVAESDILHQLLQSGCTPDGLRLVAGERGGNGADHISLIATACDPGAQNQPTGRADDPFILTATSGSTGAPKPIMLRQSTKWLRARAAIADFSVTSADITLTATPLYHTLAQRLVLIPLLSGGTCVLMQRFSPRHWVETVQRSGATFTIAVADQLRAICASPPGLRDLATLRCVVASSSPLDAATRDAVLAQGKCDFHECYGASEIGIATARRLLPGMANDGSVGRPAHGVDIGIIGPAGNAAAPGEVGEIACRTDLAFDGYFAQPEATAQAMWHGYFRTGDLGWLDQDGCLHFAGRCKDVIRTGGMNVFPADVEASLSAYPGIKEWAAFAVPDPRLGEAVGLAYVPCGSSSIDHRDMQLHCARTLADFQQPRLIVAMPSLPRNAMGKLLRHSLATLASSGAHDVANA